MEMGPLATALVVVVAALFGTAILAVALLAVISRWTSRTPGGVEHLLALLEGFGQLVIALATAIAVVLRRPQKLRSTGRRRRGNQQTGDAVAQPTDDRLPTKP